ncbi:MAG: hypothetical protein R2695_20110 [Acidimicrobiales bacterium]
MKPPTGGRPPLPRRMRRSRRSRTSSPSCTASSSIPRSCTPSTGSVIEQFLRVGVGPPDRGPWRRSSTPRSSRSGPRSAIGGCCALSGGVDSAVAAALVHRAIGDQLTCVFVDTGLMRLNEGEQVIETFEANFGVDLIHVDVGERFFGALAGVTEPEAKRKAIGELSSGCSRMPRPGSKGPTSSSRAPSIPT